MAHRMTLSQPLNGMTFIWNVSQHVGDSNACPNRPTDVNLVKILIAEWIRAQPPTWINAAMRVPFVVDGQMDPVTAYWIRILNAEHVRELPADRAGIISPAGRPRISSRDTWTIVKLNERVRQANLQTWTNIPIRPNGNPALRAELQ